MTEKDEVRDARLQPVLQPLLDREDLAATPAQIKRVVRALDEAYQLAASRRALGPLVAYVRDRALEFKTQHGAVAISVTTGNDLWQAGITTLRLTDRTDVEIDNDGDGVTFMDTTGEDRPDVAMTDALVHFHLPRADEGWDDEDDDWGDD